MTSDYDDLQTRLRPLFRRSGDVKDVLAFFAGMPEKKRCQLAPDVASMHKVGSSLSNMQALQQGNDEAISYTCSSVAFAATATLSEMDKVKRWAVSGEFCAALADRSPPWLSQALELVLERTDSSFAIGGIALFIHDLVRRGVCAAPEPDRYAIGIAFGYGLERRKGFDTPLAEELACDLEYLEAAIWRQFEVEGGGEISLANLEKFGRRPDTWAMALKHLSDSGRLDRQRLLDASLDALSRGFSQYRAGWFSRFHELMAPTKQERVTRVARYLALLASPVGPTVSLAMSALKKIQKGDGLDPVVLLEHIEPALYAKTASTVKGALMLLEQAAAAKPEASSALARTAAAALEHPLRDVQEMALNRAARRHADRRRLRGNRLTPGLCRGAVTRTRRSLAWPARATDWARGHSSGRGERRTHRPRREAASRPVPSRRRGCRAEGSRTGGA
jgi:hypothetical protein